MRVLVLIVPYSSERAERLERVRALLGNYSEYDGVGAWRGPKGLEIERHKRFECWVDNEAVCSQVVNQCKSILKDAGEHSAGYIYDGVAHVVGL